MVAARLGSPNLCLASPAMQLLIPLLLQLPLERLLLLVHIRGVQYLEALQLVCLVLLKPPLSLAPPQLLELLYHQHLVIPLRPLEHPQHLHLLVGLLLLARNLWDFQRLSQIPLEAPHSNRNLHLETTLLVHLHHLVPRAHHPLVPQARLPLVHRARLPLVPQGHQPNLLG